MAIIHVDKLSKTFRAYKKEPGIVGGFKSLFKREHFDVPAVKDVSFDIEEGELIGFIGPNGAGKTTTLKMLSGLIYPSGGEISVLGYTPFDRKKEFLKQISLVMGQKNQLWWDLPPMDSFLLNKEIYEINDTDFKERVEELSDLLDVKDILTVQVRKLSLGQRMKCELMAALLHQPKILFLDEPTIGLDVVVQQRLRRFIKTYNEKYKATILLTSHYMQDVEELCDRVIIIDHGTLKYDGALDDIIKKYSSKKEIYITTTVPIEQSDLKKWGGVKSIDGNSIVLSVDDTIANKVIGSLFKKYRVEDLAVHDVDIEDIIRRVFTKGNI